MIRVLLLACTLAWPAERSLAELQSVAGKVGEVTRFYNLYVGLDSVRSTYSTPGGIDFQRLRWHLPAGHWPYVSVQSIYPPFIDSGASVEHLTALDIMDVVGGDISNYAIRTRKGRVLLGDTTTASRLLQQGGGLQYHAHLLRISRQISPDTDHVLIGHPPGGVVLHDTLPPLSKCVGCDFWFIQYQTAIDSAWVIHGRRGDSINTDSIPGYDSVLADQTIEGFDSVTLKSNVGIARLHLLGQGNMWRVLDHHEEGAFSIALGGVSPTVFDTGWYTLDNLTSLRVRLRPMVGSSNTAGTSFPISGLTSSFTDPELDASYILTAAAIGQDSGVEVPLHCIAALSGAGIECRKSVGGPFSATGSKGIQYGVEFTGRLARPPSHR